ncbi:type VI secretion system baseplate subunit TssK [Parashewanella spongiae]|uniref:Type VI secretion system baseplate subunit TssK n=1 Tax=Parashewanella spongiae TaxID=342950 RepID=A0A3A6UBB2_9GAMM|nr:type VI secretion system baseplate subunit TssK [Parashewanella spongiae]MCL1076791.1 type VI secretion system baseplate subunit TssK [Parashewanella spongiae]RJY19284.1 type VI secretion system baseplate subunit TssK [Parashewanella spongiae]
MIKNKKITWTEGMFICPQHFQQQERYFESYVLQFINQLQHQLYGFSELEIDVEMLKIGKVRVNSAKGIFPDGTPFELNQNISIEIPNNVLKKKVYLVLPLTKIGAVEVGEAEHHRYKVFQHEAFDSCTDENDLVKLDLSDLNMQLKLEGDNLNEYAMLEVVQVMEFDSDGKVVLNEAFIPHSLQYGVSKYLGDNLRDIYALMKYRATAISNRLSTDTGSKSYQALIRDYLWLQALGVWIPQIKLLCDNKDSLTYHLYKDCIALTGHMLGLDGKNIEEFPNFNPGELYDIFSYVFSKIILLLREIQTENVHTLKWDWSLFKTRRLLRTIIKDPSLYGSGKFILLVSSSMNLSTLTNEFPTCAKLAGNSIIAELVRSALPGIPLKSLPFAPAELKNKPDTAYFEVDTKHEMWEEIRSKGEVIALHIDERIENVDIGFHIIR